LSAPPAHRHARPSKPGLQGGSGLSSASSRDGGRLRGARPRFVPNRTGPPNPVGRMSPPLVERISDAAGSARGCTLCPMRRRIVILGLAILSPSLYGAGALPVSRLADGGMPTRADRIVSKARCSTGTLLRAVILRHACFPRREKSCAQPQGSGTLQAMSPLCRRLDGQSRRRAERSRSPKPIALCASSWRG
jgi:hypothetical protein